LPLNRATEQTSNRTKATFMINGGAKLNH